LTWQAAHLLAQAERAAGQIEEAWASVCVAHQMIQQIAAASPADDLAKTLMAWPRVMAALETYRELERGK